MLESLVLAALGGVLIGLLLTLFGGGGSVLATPWLIYVVGVADTHAAIATSAAAVAVNAATGLAAGFFGIGGGFLIAPGLMAATGMTLANASASSLVSVTLFGSATSSTYALHGQFIWPLFLALITGGAVGTILAMPVLRRLEGREKWLRHGFAGLVVAVGAYILLR